MPFPHIPHDSEPKAEAKEGPRQLQPQHEEGEGRGEIKGSLAGSNLAGAGVREGLRKGAGRLGLGELDSARHPSWGGRSGPGAGGEARTDPRSSSSTAAAATPLVNLGLG